MFHAINSWLARQARRLRDARLARDQAIATAHGWQVYRVSATTYRYHDPRFDTLRRPADTTTSDMRGWS